MEEIYVMTYSRSKNYMSRLKRDTNVPSNSLVHDDSS
jgi:hypothetical protein